MPASRPSLPGATHVLVEQGAGSGSAIPDEAYVKAGAKIVPTKEEIWGDTTWS